MRMTGPGAMHKTTIPPIKGVGQAGRGSGLPQSKDRDDSWLPGSRNSQELAETGNVEGSPGGKQKHLLTERAREQDQKGNVLIVRAADGGQAPASEAMDQMYASGSQD